MAKKMSSRINKILSINSSHDYYTELISILKKQKHSINKDKIMRLKVMLCKKYSMQKIPTDIEVFLNAPSKDTAKIKHLLRTKPARTISGVAPIAVMTKPIKCPHGKCAMCPGGPQSYFGNIPQSYTGKEPATMRAIRAGYDPYMQVFNRLEQYIVLGHVPDKTELIIMGGTFPSFPKEYREEFVTYAFRAMNDFSGLFFRKNRKNEFDYIKFKKFFELPGTVGDVKRTKNIQNKLGKLKGRTKARLECEQKRNESSSIRCIGMTIETRPDYAGLKEGNEMLRLGCTRVELGIQSVYDKALQRIGRGHTVKQNIEAIKTLRNLGFKLNFHYMLGLPGINFKMDYAGLLKLFSNPNYRPDMLKLYPCMVLPGTKLYEEYKAGRFTPITTKKAAVLIAKFKQFVPEYCRIMRVQRDIPTYATIAGVDRTNLRQYVHEIMEKNGLKCRCIRCREIGRAENSSKEKTAIKITEYIASSGREFFISAESKNTLVGFCRMRLQSEFLRLEITRSTALVRELHVYGEAVSIGKKSKRGVQHKGWGRRLLEEAKKIAKQNGKEKIVIISGIGAREYYRKLGYKLEGVYMVKKI